jgi:prepilin-type N-terminal cleavage/methylation domain-containing protein
MVLPKICTHNSQGNSGFSLLEVLLVLALLSFVAGVTLIFSVRSFQSAVLQSERDVLVMQLQTARALAMQNINNLPHGLAFNPAGHTGYVLFSGINFAFSDTSTQIRIPTKAGIVLPTSTPAEIVFTQLSGESSYDGTITLIEGQNALASTSIRINYEGAIY